jgi:hypothetical protein
VGAVSAEKSTDDLLKEMESLMSRHNERMAKQQQSAHKKAAVASDSTASLGGRFAEKKAFFEESPDAHSDDG